MAEVVVALWDGDVTPTTRLHRGDLWAADDPIVKAHPDWFTHDLLSMANRSAPQILTATAAPGEVRRGPGRPPKER